MPFFEHLERFILNIVVHIVSRSQAAVNVTLAPCIMLTWLNQNILMSLLKGSCALCGMFLLPGLKPAVIHTCLQAQSPSS